MKFFLLLAAFVVSVTCLPHGQDKINLNPRIIGGSDAKRYQYPYMLSIQSFGSHACGAAVITPTFAVTAAHCFYKGQRGLVAVAGLLDQRENHPDNQKVSVVEVIPHPQYAFTYNDILLLRLETPLKYTAAVQPIRLPQSGQSVSGPLNLTGWGRISVTPSITATRLQFLQMDEISVKECNERFKENGAYPYEIIDTNICTLPRRHDQSGCHGDSGGPLVQNGTLIGVVHGGDGYCGTRFDEPSPNVFTRVSSFIDFIKEHVTDL